MVRYSVRVSGIVQGVGFRPFIHRLVKRFGLRGWVRNSSAGAELEVEGDEAALLAFAAAIRDEAPPLALIERVEALPLAGLAGYEGFAIVPSDGRERMQTLVSPDVGICPDCLRELRDPADRRFRYPFINCTNCGPRFTIIRAVPYDRAATSMADFPMCPDCAAEFADIEDRRYHAQPDCCPACGPRVFFTDAEGREPPGDAIEAARACLKAGGVLAVKGLGGVHLACDAFSPESCRALRRRKQRDEKPFAVMCRDLAAARRLCEVSEEEARALSAQQRPIVLLRKRERESFAWLSENSELGVMLPYTPLHVLLLGEDIDCLVMTSANLSDTPIVYKNGEARERLAHIADGFLLHDREILTRCDDSLLRVHDGAPYFLRRSRGYVPYPVLLPGFGGALLACGAEQKASFCLGKPGYAFPSQHIGDLKNAETLEAYEAQIAHFERLFDARPRALACDLHPDYLSTHYARARAAREGLPLFPVQHHHAHLAACMADNALAGECLGLIWDGAGLGTDGTAWGGELLAGGFLDFRRLASLRPIPLPGGDAAVKDIRRVGLALLREAGVEAHPLWETPGAALLAGMLRQGLHCPPSSGMGRLFDGVCAVLGIRTACSYEGQGAVLLEAAAEPDEGAYPPAFYKEDGVLRFDWRPMLRELCRARAAGEVVGRLAARFMNSLCAMAAAQCRRAREETGLSRVVLSGGVFQNAYLLSRLPALLRAEGFGVHIHRRVSCNDEGLSLGQLMIAEAKSHVSGGTA